MDTKYEAGSDDHDGSQELMHYISRPGITDQEVREIYDKWAPKYQHDLSKILWNAPKYGAEEVAKVLGDKKDAKILDAASGSGLGGVQLRSKGYCNIDALDASENMLQQSKKTGVYSNFHCACMGSDRLNIADDTYDVIVTVGSFVPGHVKEDCYEELIRITKPGGYIIIIMCERYFRENPSYSGNIEPRMLVLQEKGLWTRTKREQVPNYHEQYDGIVFVLQTLPGKNDKLKEL